MKCSKKKLIKDLKKLYDALGRNTNTYFSYKENISRYFTALTNEKRLLQSILKQSTPLIPEIEKGVREGLSICLSKKDWAYGISGSVKQDIKEYISNLKLDV